MSGWAVQNNELAEDLERRLAAVAAREATLEARDAELARLDAELARGAAELAEREAELAEASETAQSEMKTRRARVRSFHKVVKLRSVSESSVLLSACGTKCGPLAGSFCWGIF
jgi:septal ring factor EnvC (AmiA/AmiB activator)